MKATARKWLIRIGIPALTSFWIWFAFCLPTPLFDKEYSAILQDREDVLLAAVVAEDGQWRFPQSDSIPFKFKTALLHFEDRNFENHPGVYLPSLAQAFIENIRAGKVVRGGSTITMQVIRLSRNNPNRTYFEKFTEFFRAIRLELSYDKASILRFYAAHAPMGGNIVGLETASWRYFNRPPSELSWAEAATLAVLPNAPALIYPGRSVQALKEKRNRLLRSLHRAGHIDALTLELSLQEPVPDAPQPLEQQGLYLLEHLRKNAPNTWRFRTTLNLRTQKRADAIVRRHSERLQANYVNHAAALIADTRSGEVLAYVGNSNRDTPGGHVNIIHAPRSPGSTLKPLLFTKMIDEGRITPKSLVRDVPVNLSGFRPKNFDRTYRGMVAADEALARSLNVPAVLALRDYGVVPFHQSLQRLGFKHMNKSSSHYGLSLILGGAEVTLWELANSYRLLGAVLHEYQRGQGQYLTEPSTLRVQRYTTEESILWSSTPPHFSAGAAYACLRALESVTRPENESGWEQMASARSIAWKTGTSYGHRDAWAVGVSGAYTVCVWVGNADGTGRPGVIGSRAAAPLLFDLFGSLPSGESLPVPHDDLVEVNRCAQSGWPSGRFCDHEEKSLWPQKCAEASTCALHRPLYLTADERYRTTRECSPDGHLSNWFVLSPTEAWYYRRHHPDFPLIPSMKPGCLIEESLPQVAIVSPNNRTQERVRLTRDLDGHLQPLVVKAAKRSPGDTLFWHLDENFIGITTGLHEKEVQPSQGEHRLMVFDQSGNSDLLHIEVLP